MRKFPRLIILVLPLLCFCCGLVYQVPAIKQRINYRIETWSAALKYALHPPEKEIFIPEGSVATPALVFTFPPEALEPTPTLTVTPEPAGATKTPEATPTITLTPTPLPPQTRLEGVVHEYQSWNNCGPANLAMALSFWGWKEDQRAVAEYTKPNARDKNVMPWEMVDFVQQKTEFKAITRSGGNLQILKSLIAAGFPVLVEKGFEGPKFDGWMGHYQVLTGYNDDRKVFNAQDSYNGPNQVVEYDKLLNNWRAFNYLFIVVYPPEREVQVYEILGLLADEGFSFEHAAQLALEETAVLKGRDLYFAWFNRGTSLVNRKDYAAAATAFDAAFANYPAIPEKERPWRMLWYQTGPYFAYYYSQRYQDVIDLATATLKAASEPILEESYYWRARAEMALGDNEAAIEDLRTSLKHHPNFAPSLEQLQYLGVTP